MNIEIVLLYWTNFYSGIWQNSIYLLFEKEVLLTNNHYVVILEGHDLNLNIWR